jgi:hypothetical protein
VWEAGRQKGKLSLRRLQWLHANGTGSSAVHMAIHLSTLTHLDRNPFDWRRKVTARC